MSSSQLSWLKSDLGPSHDMTEATKADFKILWRLLDVSWLVLLLLLMDGWMEEWLQPLMFFLQIAVVSQDCVLFARSVRENIKYGYEKATDEEMFAAAKQASAHQFIEKLPNGYDTGLNPQMRVFVF